MTMQVQQANPSLANAPVNELSESTDQGHKLC